jgi:hypothetical protein
MVVVRRITGAPGITDAQESYAVSFRHMGAAAEPDFEPLDLPEALERLREFGLGDGAAEGAGWLPGPA